MAEKLTFHFDLKIYNDAGSSLYEAETTEPIGAGAYAQVWVARSADHSLLRAVKVTTTENQAKLEEEYVRLEKLRRLDDDGLIMRAFAMGKTNDNRPCMLMELVNGQPLWRLGQEIRSLLPDSLPNEWATFEMLRVRVATQITKVLYTAYKARIVLVDIKMDNLYFDPSLPQLIKVIDWNVVYTSDIPSELSKVFVNETLPKIGAIVYEIFTGLRIDSASQIGEVRSDQTWLMMWDSLTFQTRKLIRDVLECRVTQDNPALELWSNWTAHRRLLVDREGLDELRGIERLNDEKLQDDNVRSGRALQAYSVLNLLEPNSTRALGLREAWHEWISSLVTQRDFSLALLELRPARRLYSNSLRLDFLYLFALLGQHAPSRSTYLENIQSQQLLVDSYWKEGNFRKLSNLLARVQERAEEFWYPFFNDAVSTYSIQSTFDRLGSVLNLYNLLLDQEEKIRTQPAEVMAISKKLDEILESMPWLDKYLDDHFPFNPTARELWDRQMIYHSIYASSLAVNDSVPRLIHSYDELARKPHLDPRIPLELIDDIHKLRAFDSIVYAEINPLVQALEVEFDVQQNRIPGLLNATAQTRRKLIDLRSASEKIQQQSNELSPVINWTLDQLEEKCNDVVSKEKHLITSLSTIRGKLSRIGRIQQRLIDRSKSHASRLDTLDHEYEILDNHADNQLNRLRHFDSLIGDLWQSAKDIHIRIEALQSEQQRLDKAFVSLNYAFDETTKQISGLFERAETSKSQLRALDEILSELNTKVRDVLPLLTKLDLDRQFLDDLSKNIQKKLPKIVASGTDLENTVKQLNFQFSSISGIPTLLENQAKEMEEKNALLEERRGKLTDSLGTIQNGVRVLEEYQTSLESQLALAGHNNVRLREMLANEQPGDEFRSLLQRVAELMPVDAEIYTRVNEIEQKLRTWKRNLLIGTAVIALLLAVIFILSVFGAFFGFQLFGQASPTSTLVLAPSAAQPTQATSVFTALPPTERSLTQVPPTIISPSPTVEPTAVVPISPTIMQLVSVNLTVRLTLNSADNQTDNSILAKVDGKPIEIDPGSQIILLGIDSQASPTHILIETSEGNIGWVMAKYVNGWQQSDLSPVVACYSLSSFVGYDTLPSAGAENAPSIEGVERTAYQALAINGTGDTLYIRLKFAERDTGWVQYSMIQECVGDLDVLPVESQ